MRKGGPTCSSAEGRRFQPYRADNGQDWDALLRHGPPCARLEQDDLQEMVVSGETILLNCADERRRDYAVFVVRKMGLRAGVPAAKPAIVH